MTRNTFYTIFFCAWLFLLTVLYLASLWLSLPVWCLVLLLAVASLLGWKYKPDFHEHATASKKNDWLEALILCMGLGIIIYKAWLLEEKYGHWDAWWFWNVRADFLLRPDYWKLAFSGTQMGGLFTVPVAHSDYPPFLPLLNALCWRLTGTHTAFIPFIWSMLSFLLLPAILFLETYPKNKLVGIAVLVFFATQERMMWLGSWQIADGWIALCLLLAFIAYEHYQKSEQTIGLLLAALMLGMCCWAKNEGIILTGVFLLFNSPTLYRQKKLKLFVAGIAGPALVLLVFKLFLAPANDVLAAQHAFPWDKIKDPSRYKEIILITRDVIKDSFPALPYLLGGYFLICIFRRRWPSRMFAVLTGSFILYCGVYVITPHNLGWHVSTSVDRLLMQLIPSFIWIVALSLNGALPGVEKLHFFKSRP